MLDDLLTTTEAAELIGRTRAALRQACERGVIAGAVNKGGMWLMPRESAVLYGKTAKRGRPFGSVNRPPEDTAMES